MKNTHICPNCNSEKIETRIWIKMNSLNNKRTIDKCHITSASNIDDENEKDFWCPECEEHIIPIVKEE